MVPGPGSLRLKLTVPAGVVSTRLVVNRLAGLARENIDTVPSALPSPESAVASSPHPD